MRSGLDIDWESSILVHLKPGSRQELIDYNGANQFTIKTSRRAVDGMANKAMIEMLAGYLGIAKTRVIHKKGFKSRTKVVEIKNAL